MLKRNPLLESTHSSIATVLRPLFYGRQSQGVAVRRQAEDINCCIATDDGPPLCISLSVPRLKNTICGTTAGKKSCSNVGATILELREKTA
jgi:hypothetical protein